MTKFEAEFLETLAESLKILSKSFSAIADSIINHVASHKQPPPKLKVVNPEDAC